MEVSSVFTLPPCALLVPSEMFLEYRNSSSLLQPYHVMCSFTYVVVNTFLLTRSVTVELAQLKVPINMFNMNQYNVNV